MNQVPITHPWAIVHQRSWSGPLETMLGGPTSATHREFALVAADLIRHIAKFKSVAESEVLALVSAELNAPTSEISDAREVH